jgi:hypothetical protein
MRDDAWQFRCDPKRFVMRSGPLVALALAALMVLAAWPADAQTRARRDREAYPGAGYAYGQDRYMRRGGRTRITVRRARSFLDPGTEVLPRSQAYLDYAYPPLWRPYRIYDPTGSFLGPLPDNNFWMPGTSGW